MIKRTLYFGNPAYLHTRLEQLVVTIPHAKGLDELSGNNTIPIEDIGVVMLDHPQITLTQALMEKLLANKVALISCDAKHHPVGLMLPLDSNTIQQERFEAQIAATETLKKQLWQQTVKAKIANQTAVLWQQTGIKHRTMIRLEAETLSGDTSNCEAQAAVYYWKTVFPQLENFRRDREGEPPNAVLNYGYAILRALVARALAAGGLLPTLGIFHHNRYNAYCLADDVMEPYRAYVDQLVIELMKQGEDCHNLNQSIKISLLGIPTQDVVIEGKKNPLMIALGQTVASLRKCYEGSARKIHYPTMD